MTSPAGHTNNTPETRVDVRTARRCLRGDLVAEELSIRARELVVAWLHQQSCTDVEVARRTGMTTYTAARIRARLSLPVHRH